MQRKGFEFIAFLLSGLLPFAVVRSEDIIISG